MDHIEDGIHGTNGSSIAIHKSSDTFMANGGGDFLKCFLTYLC